MSACQEPPPDATSEGLTCSCGNEPDPSESPSTGLYIAEDGSLAYICLPCWQREACDCPLPN